MIYLINNGNVLSRGSNSQYHANNSTKANSQMDDDESKEIIKLLIMDSFIFRALEHWKLNEYVHCFWAIKVGNANMNERQNNTTCFFLKY